MIQQYWHVAVDAPLQTALTYASDPNIENHLKRGLLVEVPLGKRAVSGVIINKAPEPNTSYQIKNIKRVIEEYPVLPENFIRWLEWLSKYYFHPLGTVTSLSYPPLPKATKERKSKRPPVIKETQIKPKPVLTKEQSNVISEINQSSGFSAHLLFGVTGSGKTEVYLQLLEQTLHEGKVGLVLVPEISLTPQLVDRFASRFGDKVAVIHSQLTDRERTNQWWDIVEGRKNILIGARSALFCPIDNLGLIIVDEEHEPSFKQDEKLKYNARDAAVALAKFQNCKIILGSATPSLETWKNAQDGKYKLHKMQNRVENRSLPQVAIVDMRAEKENKERSLDIPGWMSQQLYEQIQATLKKKEQVALFLNRRGMAPIVLCGDCGFIHECPNCDIALTLHGRHHLVCHYCDYHESFKEICPDCKLGELKPLGLGTELVESDMRKLFPEHKIARADRDEIQTREDLEKLIEEMETGEIDILIGTQMIAKGLDFPHLTLVGLVLADVGFNLPDFRSTERSFQLITQVSGRAGRHIKIGDEPGQVIVQTYNPEHASLTHAQKNDYESFAQEELENRQALNYPPFGKLISIRFQGTQLDQVEKAGQLLQRRAFSLSKSNQLYEKIEVLGPAEAPLAKLRGQFRHHLLIKGPDNKTLNSFLVQLMGDESWTPAGIRFIADVDPVNLL